MDPISGYSSQTAMSDPGPYTHLFDDLPDDLTGMCRAVQGIYLHYFVARGIHKLPATRIREVNTRRLDLILQRITELDPRPLTVPRAIDKRFVGCCRDASLLLCAMLRHKGIPARLRVGFAGYFGALDPTFHFDHVVTEYHDGTRWKLVDAEQSEEHIRTNNIRFDVQDIPRDQFILGGRAWEMIRRDEILPNRFGVDPRDNSFRGTWAVRNRMLHDLATLNRTEMLLWDTWGLMERDAAVGDDENRMFDRIAELTQAGDEAFAERQAIYQDARLRRPRTFMSFSPVEKPSRVTIPVSPVT